jgi:hypothetical protein
MNGSWSARGATLSVVAVAGVLAAAGCAQQLQPPAPNEGRLTLTLSNVGLTLGDVSWQIQTTASPPVVVRSGRIAVSDPNATETLYLTLPAGTGYVAVMTADIAPPTGNAAYCSGTSTAFDIVAAQERSVTIQLICGSDDPPRGIGGANIPLPVVAGDNCPVLTSWMASSPLQSTAPDGLIDLSASATDADANDLLTYSWTATAGTFTSPDGSATSSTTQYRCTTAGLQTVTVTVTDNHVPANCSVSQTLPINCDAGGG